jgi:hypothetical protein
VKCPAPEQLAAAVTEADHATLAHLDDCAACSALLDGQQQIHVLVQAIPAATLSRAHRETLAAEILARADAVPASRGSRVVAVLAYLPGRGEAPTQTAVAPPVAAPRPQITPIPEPPAPPPAPVVAPSPPPPAPATLAKAKVGGTGEFAREARGDRDVVKLAGGDLTVDAVGTRAVSVVNGDTDVAVHGSRVKVTAKRGVIAQVAVFAGSAEITVAGKTVVIEAGMTWDRNATREDSLAAFRTGWEALRAGNNADAVAAFDLATDDVVAEDALYWSAIASERLHDDAAAVRRYRDLLARFPKSPRAASAETAIARLAP